MPGPPWQASRAFRILRRHADLHAPRTHSRGRFWGRRGPRLGHVRARRYSGRWDFGRWACCSSDAVRMGSRAPRAPTTRRRSPRRHPPRRRLRRSPRPSCPFRRRPLPPLRRSRVTPPPPAPPAPPAPPPVPAAPPPVPAPAPPPAPAPSARCALAAASRSRTRCASRRSGRGRGARSARIRSRRALVRGTWTPPNEGEALAGAGGKAGTWTKATADAERRVRGRRGGRRRVPRRSGWRPPSSGWRSSRRAGTTSRT